MSDSPLLPRELRRPVGISRVLRAPEDYHGARIYIREGKLAAATFQALGGRSVRRPNEEWPTSVDAAELGTDALRKAPDAARRAAGVTANVVLWPMPMTVVINQHAFERLSDAQQKALRQAATDAAFERKNRLVPDLEDVGGSRPRRCCTRTATATSLRSGRAGSSAIAGGRTIVSTTGGWTSRISMAVEDPSAAHVAAHHSHRAERP